MAIYTGGIAKKLSKPMAFGNGTSGSTKAGRGDVTLSLLGSKPFYEYKSGAEVQKAFLKRYGGLYGTDFFRKGALATMMQFKQGQASEAERKSRLTAKKQKNKTGVARVQRRAVFDTDKASGQRATTGA